MGAQSPDLAALTRMFSAAVMREFGRRGTSALFSRLLGQSGVLRCLPPEATVGDVFNRAFELLRMVGNRDEYVYRSAITQKILLGQHSLRTAAMLSEARVGMRKADVVVLNGTATAYEIKSERDSLARLGSQVSAYKQVFAAVNVLTSPSHAQKVLREVPDEVGVLVLSERFTLRTERPAVIDANRTNPLAMMDFVRTDEAFAILRALAVETPDVPNTQVRGALHELFDGLDPSLVHQRMVETLRETRSQSASATFIKTVPMSLRAAMLTLKMDGASQRTFRDATLLPVHAAATWS